jgi:hypothetical protein
MIEDIRTSAKDIDQRIEKEDKGKQTEHEVQSRRMAHLLR